MFFLKRYFDFNFNLYLSTILANIFSFTVGCYFGWSSPALPKLKGLEGAENNPLNYPITSEDESWIASLLPLGAATSTFISGYASDRIGRKYTLALAALTSIIGLVVSIVTSTVAYLCLSRFLCGLGVGTVFTVMPIYVGEIAEDNNRGILGCVMVLAITIGIVFAYAIGPIVSLQVMAFINLGLTLAFLLLFLTFIPESPYYLLEKKYLEKAEESLKYLRKNGADIRGELSEMSRNIEDAFDRGGLMDLLKEKPLFKALCITCSLVLFQQLSGVNVILFYMETIFGETGSSMSANTSSVIIGIVQVVTTIMTSIFVDKSGRKILLFISCIGTGVSLTAFGVYFYLKQIEESVHNIYWLPILSIIFFMIAYALGLGPIPFIVLSEVFPTNVKSAASTVTIFICLVFTFCTTTFFPPLIDVIGMAYTFWTLAVFCFIGAMFVHVHLPETKGKSLHDIQEILKND